MNKVIIYKTEDGIAIVNPSPYCGLTVEQVALKDVPFGKPFKIIDISELPEDQTTRNAWIVDESDLTDGIGANYGVGSDYPFIMSEIEQ